MNLESLLGRDVLKTADFKLNADGSVSSGKPLTQRRIQAIVNKALTTSRGEYDIGIYKAKLGAIRADIAALPARRAYDKAGATAHFEAVEKLMTFVDKEIDGLIDDYYAYDKTAPQSETNYPYVMVSKLDGQYEEKPLTSLSMVTDYVSKATGQLFHLQENIISGPGLGAHLEDLTDPPKQIKAYLKRAMMEFIMTSIDTWLDAKSAGKTDAYLSTLTGSWPCIEGKTSGITEFRLKHLPVGDAGPVATHNNDQPLNQCIGREITALTDKGVKFESWKDVAAEVKKNLVGTIRPIDVPVAKGDSWKFEPLLDEKGKPVVRAITWT